ncbi:hypothetical protein AOLI_G00173700 [Acnodon oligacanthus]
MAQIQNQVLGQKIPESSPETTVEPTVEPVSEPVPEPVVEHNDVAASPMEAEGKTPSFKPGKKKAMKFDTRMTKEELEEEQRVQREQLAAIFKLLKDNQDTFGEVTEGDVEEQLKLYTE